jgi:hypothetical protein
VSVAHVATAHGVYAIDVDADELLGIVPDADVPPPRRDGPFPRTVAADSHGSRAVVVVERRPPLLLSHDAGTTWSESGGGLPPGRAVAISPEHPDVILYAARNRLFVSRDGGRFWAALTVELPEIDALAWAAGEPFGGTIDSE